ncbi:YtxH domain-containing protein [Leucobacter weissii]|uniref:YtxH domain-containing protein n=1 Tax=Leucobacter weissii TaxID=1983706 RepID=A0A939MQJ8_9MICO|nr:YtxH domain-containing protein [Leucobacter weissii]MBO1902872.1 YtxH domain-containing protein [Leucobacter weissii]
MRRLSWLVVGAALGFVAAHFVNQTPEGRRFFERVGRGAREFGDAIAEGYREAEEEFVEVLDDVERRLTELESKN